MVPLIKIQGTLKHLEKVMPQKIQNAISLDMGGTYIKGALVSRRGKIEKKLSVPTGAGTGRDAVIKNIIEMIYQLNKGAENVIGIGVGAPGSIDTKTGTILGSSINISQLNGIRLPEELNGKFTYPVYVDNDATNAVKGEFLFGSGRGFQNIIGITLGTGIGGGIILNGDVYHGTSDYAGEIGHMNLIPGGRECGCGSFGCFEAYSSATAMVKAACLVNKRRLASMLHDYEDEEINTEVIMDLATKGDRYSIEIIHEASKYIGIMLASVTNLLNLQLCIIGGGVSAAGSIFFEGIDSYFYAYAMNEAARHCKIVPAELGNDAGAIGAAAMVFRNEDKKGKE